MVIESVEHRVCRERTDEERAALARVHWRSLGIDDRWPVTVHRGRQWADGPVEFWYRYEGGRRVDVVSGAPLGRVAIQPGDVAAYWPDAATARDILTNPEDQED